VHQLPHLGHQRAVLPQHAGWAVAPRQEPFAYCGYARGGLHVRTGRTHGSSQPGTGAVVRIGHQSSDNGVQLLLSCAKTGLYWRRLAPPSMQPPTSRENESRGEQEYYRPSPIRHASGNAPGQRRGCSRQQRRRESSRRGGFTARCHWQGGGRHVGRSILPGRKVVIGVAHRRKCEGPSRVRHYEVPERLHSTEAAVGGAHLFFDPVDVGPTGAGPAYVGWRPQGGIPFTGQLELYGYTFTGVRGRRSDPPLQSQVRADGTIEVRRPTPGWKRPNRQCLRTAGEREPLLLTEELQGQRSAVLEHRPGYGDGPGYQGKYHLMGHEEIVGAATDGTRHRDAGRRRLRVAPHTIDHRWLERRWPAELQPKVTREPRRSHHIHLFAYVDRVRRYNQSNGRLPPRRWRSPLQQSA
jgi:hypothetical protein